MPTNLGYAFEPNADQAAQAKTGAISPPFGSQGAVQTLNYQLPNTGGAVGAAISPLVGQQRQASGITSAVLQSVLRTVLGPDHANMVLSGSSAQPDERAGNGPQDYASPVGAQQPDPSPWNDIGSQFGAPTTPAPVTVHVGDDFQRPHPSRDTLGPPPDGKVDTTPPVGGFHDSLNNENAINGRGSIGPQTPNFGGGGREWLRNK